MRRHVKMIVTGTGLLAGLACGILFPLSAVAADTLVRFRGAIGVLPVASGVGDAATAEVVNLNVVRGVPPAPQIWVMSALTADVKTDGHIRVNGKGLLLGGGNEIGFNGNASVFATLICEAAAPFTELSTNAAGVALDPNGNFVIDDVLAPAPPADCASPVLLIRVTAGPWFAAGIPVSSVSGQTRGASPQLPTIN
jgi:hypothetical protein